MTAQELKNYIDRTLGTSIRCLLPSYWWRRLFGLVVDKIDETDNKVSKLPTKNYVDNAISELPTKDYVNETIKSAVADVEIDVDSSMSDTSTNPVQNKVIMAYVDSKFDNIDLPIDVSMSDTSTNAVQNKVIKSYVDKNISRSYIIITVDKVVELDGYDSEYKYKQILLQPNEPTVVYVSSFRLDTGSDGSKVTNIRLRNLDTSYAYSFHGMFADAYSEIEELDVSHFVTKDVVEMNYMFARCSSLKHLDVSSFNTKKVRDISTMFYMCSSLTSLDLSSFDLSSVTSSDKYVNNTFGGCTLLSTLILGNGFFKAPVSGTADFSDLKNWTNESVISSLVTNSYDRVANELPVLTLKLSNATKAVLTEEHVTIMNNKGYTIN